MYYNPETKQLVTRLELEDILNASIPVDEPDVEPWIGIGNLIVEPEYDIQKQMTGELTVVEKDGRYVMTYKVIDLDNDQQKEVIKGLFRQLRDRRNERLADCDYMFLTDAIPDQQEEHMKWMEYRQKLRDITGLEGAPWDGGGKDTPWPVAPNEEPPSVETHEAPEVFPEEVEDGNGLNTD